MEPTNTNNEDKSLAKELKKCRWRYAESFTVHGINHIIHGNVPEKVLWTVLVLGAIVGTGLMTREIFESYLDHDVTTKIVIKQNHVIKAPTIYLCNRDVWDNLLSYSDCSSNTTKSYNHAKCVSLERKCPMFAANITDDYSCPDELHGQCIAFNANGSVVMNLKATWMAYEIGNMTAEHLPLYISTT